MYHIYPVDPKFLPFFERVQRIFLQIHIALNVYRGIFLKYTKRVQGKKCVYHGKKVMKTKRVHMFIQQVRVHNT